MSGRGYICSGLKSQGPPEGVGWNTESEHGPETKTDACRVCRGVGLVGEEHICSGLIESRTNWGKLVGRPSPGKVQRRKPTRAWYAEASVVSGGEVWL